MSSLLLKDILNLRKYLKTIAFALLMYCFLFYSMDNVSFLSGMIIMLFVMIPISSFSYDIQSKWDTFALSMPFTRKDLVLSKYVLSITFIAIGVILGFVISYVLTLIKSSEVFDMKEQLLTIYVLFAVGVTIISTLLPLIYKYGVEKSRIMMIAVFMIPTAIVVIISKLGFTLPADLNYKLILAVSPIVILLIMITSYFISLRIFMKKDL